MILNNKNIPYALCFVMLAPSISSEKLLTAPYNERTVETSVWVCYKMKVGK